MEKLEEYSIVWILVLNINIALRRKNILKVTFSVSTTIDYIP